MTQICGVSGNVRIWACVEIMNTIYTEIHTCTEVYGEMWEHMGIYGNIHMYMHGYVKI